MISLNSVLLLLLVNFVSGSRFELMYVSLIVSISWSLASPWFSTACAAAIIHWNDFFRLHQQNKTSKSKVKFRQASSRCKRFLEVTNRASVNKAKECVTSKKLGSRAFGELPIVFSTNADLLYSLYSTARRCCFFHLIKQNCLLNTFLRTLILMIQVSLYLFSLLELTLKCIIFL